MTTRPTSLFGQCDREVFALHAFVACPWCLGDMLHEIWAPESAGRVCSQCGHRLTAHANRISSYAPRELRLDQAIDHDLSPTREQAGMAWR